MVRAGRRPRRMLSRLQNLWEKLRASYWFVPAIMCAGAVALALVLAEADRRLGPRIPLPWLSDRSAEGARALLSAIAASIITVAGTVFSITIVALTLASSQFGPRLLRTFMADLGNQAVLGTFTSTFVYSLLVLRTIGGEEDGSVFVPHLAVSAAFLLAVLSVGVLIYFIHHVAVSIQANHIIAAVAADLERELDRLFPEQIGAGPPPHPPGPPRDIPHDFERRAAPIPAHRNGYVRIIDEDRILAIAERADIVIRVVGRPGRFVARDETLAFVYPAERLTGRLEHNLRRTFVLGHVRTPIQDAEFAFNQIVEIAVRALSKAINDPFTAVTCLDWLGACLRKAAGKAMPSPCRYGPSGRLRVVADPIDFVQMMHKAFEPIRQHGSGDAMVAARLLDTVASIAPCIQDPADRRLLLNQAERIRASIENQQAGDPQQAHLDRKFRAAEQAVQDGHEPAMDPSVKESTELG